MEPPSPQSRLTPSEVVYLAADRFAPPGKDGGKSHWLPNHAYAAAFLAAEQGGMLRLEIRAKKALLGLRTVETLYADPTGSAGAFPAESLESTLHVQAVSLSKKNKHDVRDIVASLFSGTSVDPWSSALHRIRDALGARGLLTATSKKALKIIKVVEYATPEQTTAMAEEKVSEVQRLLHECQAARPDLWERLIDEIDSGIRSHEHETSMPDID